MTRPEFNKDFICRYYADKSRRSDHVLLGFDGVKKVLKTYTRARRVFDRLAAHENDTLTIDLRTGEQLVFICR